MAKCNTHVEIHAELSGHQPVARELQAQQVTFASSDLNACLNFPVRGGVFPRVKAYVHAVDGVSFDLAPREILGL